MFFQVGSIEKSVEVFGDRYFKPGVLTIAQTRPIPFEEMDITWENAFGGPDYEHNTSGKGMVPVKNEKGEILYPLPNIENRDRLINSLKDRPLPAGFGPMGLDWPVRLKKLGKFDKEWLRSHWPGLPEDFNFEYFNQAPVDQRIKGYFKGDESVHVRGMHPEKHDIFSQLPGLRPRLFLKRVTSPEQELEEIKCRLDTVCLIPHYELGVLIWHGLVQVEDDEAEDISLLAAFYESMEDSPQSIEYYQEKLPVPEEEVEDEPPASGLKDAPEEETEDAPEAPPAAPQMPADLAALAAESALALDLIKKELLGFGIDLDAPAAESGEPSPDLAPVEEEKTLAELEKEAAEAEAEIDKTLQEIGVDPAPPAEAPPPVAAPAGEIVEVFDQETIETSMQDLEKMGVNDPEVLGMIREVFAGQKILAADLAALEEDVPEKEPGPPAEEAAADGAPPEAPAPPPPLTREDVLAGYTEKRSFAGEDLSGLDLSGCDLKGIDLSDAVLENVDLSGADLSGAGLERAVLTGAILEKTILNQSRLTESSAAGTNFSGAEITDADLKSADFIGANFAEACLEKADLTDSTFNETDLSGADCSGVKAVRTEFIQSKLTGVNFRNADLLEADLTCATLDGADFSQAQARDLRLIGTIGKGATFAGAGMQNSRAGDGTSLNHCQFGRADLGGASWSDTDLSESNFSMANMQKAQMNRCNFHGANLFGVNGVEANLSKSDFTGAKMPSINLMSGSFRKSRLVKANLQGANLYGVDFYKSVMHETNMLDANLDRTLLGMSKVDL